MSNVLIINTGGTFNKVYDEIDGKLIVPKNDKAIVEILEISKIKNIDIKGLIYKDSLEMTDDDRKELLEYIKQHDNQQIIIIHGTDTIDITAKYLDDNLKDLKISIILTGAMKPFSINHIEATSNLMLAIGYIRAIEKNGIYIAMHGLVKHYKQLTKNRKQGVFECL